LENLDKGLLAIIHAYLNRYHLDIGS